MKRLSLIPALIALLLLTPESAAAHALPVQSIPEANAVLERPPAQIEIFFSEALEPSFSTITVFDSGGNQVDNGDSRVDPADPTRLTVTLRSLPDGVYTVVWQVLSTVDGHVTAGSFPIAVGAVDPAALAEAAQASQQFNLSTLDIIARWLVFLTSVSFAGGALFLVLAWEPAQPGDDVDKRARAIWKPLGLIALTAFVVGNILSIMVQAGLASGAELAPPWSDDFATVLFTTRFGAVVVARLIGALVLARFQLNDDRGRAVPWATLGIALLILLSISLNSHGAASDAPVLPILADWLHLTAAGVWVGGLMVFVSAMWAIGDVSAAERTGLLARLIPRFTRLALPAVAVLALTGLYAYLLNVGPIDNLLNTLYGQTLIVKSLLFLPALALGAANFLIITGKMKAAAGRGGAGDLALVRRFRGMISGEVALGAAILLSVGVLTVLPQAKSSLELPALEEESEADDLFVELNVSPGRVGTNTFTATVTRDGRPLEDANEVALRFTPETSNLPPAEVELASIGDGQYQVEGSYFSLPDTWQVQVSVRRENAFDAFANLDFDVGVTGGSAAVAWGRVTAILLVILGCAYLFAATPADQPVRYWLAFNLLPALVVVAAGLVIFTRSGHGELVSQANPIPPNADSIAIGEQLYAENCLPCHGASGAGDGPVGVTLNPPPADLTVHTVPGVHSDGQLYAWISDGFPGSSIMPAFRDHLSEEERWHLVNYLRTLAS